MLSSSGAGGLEIVQTNGIAIVNHIEKPIVQAFTNFEESDDGSEWLVIA